MNSGRQPTAKNELANDKIIIENFPSRKYRQAKSMDWIAKKIAELV
jgi:hypothetical protein